MDHVSFGSTGHTVSVAGLGCGGYSKLGLSQGSTAEEAVEIVKLAIDLGITYFDTAAIYETEEIVGLGVEGHRDEVMLSTKVTTSFPIFQPSNPAPVTMLKAADIRESVHQSLRNLRTDHVDVVHVHGVRDATYDYCLAEFVPELQRLHDEGKVGHIGISERFGADLGHGTLVKALDDKAWEVMMVGFNYLNQSARDRVIVAGTEKGVGIEIMYAVRRALRSPTELRAAIQVLLDGGHLDFDWATLERELGFLLNPGEGTSITDVAYRFVRHEPGDKVVLTGTGNPEHLKANVASINRGPLSEVEHGALLAMFGHLEHLTAGER